MLKKISAFIVNKRYFIMAVMLIISVACVALMQYVEINDDMTKYLPDNSPMKTGVDIMSDEFPKMEMSNTIRVMSDGLSAEQKGELLNKLETLPYVDSVTYEPDSADYNKDGHTLFVINTKYGYNSPEELSIEKALDEDFTEYSILWHNDSTDMPDLPMWIIMSALGILMIILFAMCGSWIEPILFIVVIGIAVVINMGTNIIMGSVSDVTSSIASILQLVLSMDYSIILINRYRQEKEKIEDNKEAMKAALAHAFSSVASSSLTTVVGLLMLVFMSFKIGMDLGVVLAKGVFISMVCVLMILPGIILACDKLIQKTAKKELHIPMEWAAKFSYRFRRVMGIAFVVIFAGVYLLQTQTEIAYTLQKEDKVAEIFPATNTLVMVYETKDGSAVGELADELESNESVKSVTNVFNMLEKPYSYTELAEKISDMGSDVALDESVIKMLYYDYFSDDASMADTEMTVSELLNFISENVVNNVTFSERIGDDLLDNIEMIKKFSDADTLTKPMNAAELAGFFDMDEADIQNLFLYYNIQKGGIDTGKMTLSDFADFVVNEVAADETYGSLFDEETLSQMAQLTVFTDKEKMTVPYDSKQIADLMGIDESMVRQIFVMYYGAQSVEQGIAFVDFTDFLVNNILQNPTYSVLFDETNKAQLIQMNGLAKTAASGQALTAAQLAQIVGMNETQVGGLLALSEKDSVTIPEFVNLCLSENFSAMLDDTSKMRLQALKQIIDIAVSGQKLTYSQLAASLGLEETQAKQLFILYWGQDISGKTLTVQQAVNFIFSDETMSSALDVNTKNQLGMAQALINSTVNDATYSSDELATLIGMEKSQSEQLYILYMSRHGDTSEWTLSVKEFIDFINGSVLNNPDFSGAFDNNTADMLKTASNVVNGVVSGSKYTATQMSELFSGVSDELDGNTMEMLYLYAASDKSDMSSKAMSIETLFGYITDNMLNDPRFSGFIDDEMRNTLSDAQKTLDDGKKQLSGDRYSRMIITTDYAEESSETTAFIDSLNSECSEKLTGDFYLIGNSAMTYEMKQIFDKELVFITLLTAVAIFIIVALTFKSVSIPLILVLVVQCGVYATISVIGLQGGSIYYLALLIVECILMGATIDYGILFTNYYCENRKTLPIKESLSAAYSGATHTILTSGLILILVTAVVGNFFEEPTVSAIVKTVSIGALSATLLILFVLPSVLAVCDRLVIRKAKKQTETASDDSVK
ncbi:MAG: MMPL family transporter [Lachnospiraceae bacterium]|nr:MMPL family transporter [Ruminococcus sp.]MCM1276958.1 MMPL family transporter [Lachnospiraceae bacterium]